MTDEEAEALMAEINAGLKAHESHRASWRLDPDGFYRCPECDPVPPTSWVQLIPNVPRNRLARTYWATARAIVGWWERTADAIRGRRRR